MQTSKIKIGNDYAYKYDGELVRFRVTAIVTTRKGDKASDTSNEVHGFMIDEDDGRPVNPRKLYPSDLIGPYEEQAELVARKKAADEERERKLQKDKDDVNEVVRALYHFVGQPMPAKKDDFTAIFRAHYSGGVEINRDGVKALIAKFENKKFA